MCCSGHLQGGVRIRWGRGLHVLASRLRSMGRLGFAWVCLVCGGGAVWGGLVVDRVFLLGDGVV